jgi:hypothetical protein
MGGLVDRARRDAAGFAARQAAYEAWPTQARLGLLSAAAGALAALILSRLGAWIPWRRLRSAWPRRKPH